MEYFTITDYDYKEPKEIKADTLILSDRKIFASNYENQDDIEIRIDNGILSVIIDGEYHICSCNWTTSYCDLMDKEEKEDLKDFTYL